MAKVKLLDWDLSGREGFAIAEHDGYQRLAEPVTHRRRISGNGRQGWQITDEVRGSGSHLFETFFHFPPGAVLKQLTENCLRASYGANWQLEISSTVPGGSICLVEEGWVSKTWNQKEQAPVLIWRWEGRPPASWEYNLRIVS
jgi:hypothetical protein